MVEFVRINSINYGKSIAFFDRKRDRLDNGYIVRCFKNFKMLSGYIDSRMNLIIDLDEMAFNNYFYSNLGDDMCLSFMMPNGVNRYFHVRHVGKRYELPMQTDPESPIVVTPIKNDKNHWLFTTISDDPKLVLYNYNLGDVTTTTFDRIELVDGSDKHKYYYEKDLYGIFENEKVYLTTLCGFMDKDANLSSDIFDSESDNLIYDANIYRNTLTSEFNVLCDMLINNYVNEYLDKEANNKDVIDELFNTPVELTDVKDAKVYKFKGKKV